jgi:hypothetical protein
MAHNPRRGDGSTPAIGELVSEASGGGARTARRGEQAATLTTDPTSSPDMTLHNDAARAALAAYNSGAVDQGGPVQGLDADVPPGGSGTSGSGNTWGDTSSLSR